MKASELVDMINKAGLNTPYEVDEMEDIGEVEMIAAVDRSEHRWYCLGTVVFRTGEEYFEVNGPVSLKSESMTYSDVGVTCEAFLMERVPSFTYKRREA